jgi:hypothetical protein
VPLLVAMHMALNRATGAAPPSPSGPPPLTSEDDYRREMAAAGFAEVQVTTVTGAIEAATTAELWELFVRTNAPVALARRRVGEDRWPAVSQEVLAQLEQDHGRGPQRVETPAFIAVGRRPARSLP